MSDLPLSEAEIKAGLDCLDEPWPVVELERRFEGREGQAWSYPRFPRGDGGETQLYVPATAPNALTPDDKQRLREIAGYIEDKGEWPSDAAFLLQLANKGQQHER